jgi:histidinol-phosphate phosphatase family protein
MKNILVCLDRDETLIYDNKCHLGHQNNWKSKVKILPNVVRAIKKLNKIPNLKIYMITNQPGVAIKEFKLLNLKRAHEVCRYVIKQIEKKGAKIDGYFLCPDASKEFAKSHPEFTFNNSKLDKCNCMKPKTEMVIKSLKAAKFKKADIYVIGDRSTDVETALRMKGTGVLIPYQNNRPEDIKKVRKLKGKKYIKKNLIEAIKLVEKNQKTYI